MPARYHKTERPALAHPELCALPSGPTSSSVSTCGGVFSLCGGTCPPMQTCGGLLCQCQ